MVSMNAFENYLVAAGREGLINWEYFKSDSFWTYPHEAEEQCGLH